MEKAKFTILVAVLVFGFSAPSRAVIFDFQNTGWPGDPDTAQVILSGLTVDINPFASTDPNGTVYPAWSALSGAGVGIYPGSTGLGVKAYSTDNVDLDGSTQRESLLFTFGSTVVLNSIHFASVGSTDDFNLTLDGVNQLIDVAPNPTGDPNLRNLWHNVSFTGNQFRIWADGADDDFRVAGLDVTAVPEPSTLLLLGSGLMGMAFWRKNLGRKKS